LANTTPLLKKVVLVFTNTCFRIYSIILTFLKKIFTFLKENADSKILKNIVKIMKKKS